MKIWNTGKMWKIELTEGVNESFNREGQKCMPKFSSTCKMYGCNTFKCINVKGFMITETLVQWVKIIHVAPAHNCTDEYTGETIWSLKERLLDHRNQTTSAIRNNHISTNHPKAELKDFTIKDRNSSTLHHQGKEALHIDPFIIQQILKPHT